MRNALRLTIPAPNRAGDLSRDLPRRTLGTGAMVLAAALAFAAAYELHEPAGSGRAIRSELLAAADELSGQIVANPTEAVRQAMRRHFREAEVDVDAAPSWPNVLVTLRGLDRATCEAAARDARRVEGPVVIALDGYRSTADCGARNNMTLWLMP